MRSQDKNFKSGSGSFWDSTGKGSSVALLLLSFLIMNPVAKTVYAEESVTSETPSEDGIAAEESGEPNAQSDDAGEPDGATGPSKAARAATASTVNIAFNPTSANGTVTPVDASGAKAKVDVTATVRVQNSGGYSVYVGSSSSQLKAGSNVIDSVTSSTTYENMPLNRWGYSFAQGTTASNTYNAMPATLRGTALDSNTSTSIKDETRTYTLSFAANIGADKPAGTYTNQVTMSVVSNPLEVTAMTYSVTYEHTAFSGSLTLPNKQEAESEASSYTFTLAASPGNYFKEYAGGGGGCVHPFTGWTVSQAEYNDSPEYLAGGDLTLTEGSPSITLYPAFRTSSSGCYNI